MDPALVQRAVKQAERAAGVTKAASCHTFLHSFATHLLERGPLGVCSPADLLYHHEPLWADPPIKAGMILSCVNPLALQAFSEMPADFLLLIGSQNGRKGGSIRIPPFSVGWTR